MYNELMHQALQLEIVSGISAVEWGEYLCLSYDTLLRSFHSDAPSCSGSRRTS